MSTRLTDQVVTITVPAAEIACDGPCRRTWPYVPNVLYFQEADVFMNTPDMYAVRLRHVVGGKHPLEVDKDKHLCADCVALVTDEHKLQGLGFSRTGWEIQ